jgi:hypothetical protein
VPYKVNCETMSTSPCISRSDLSKVDFVLASSPKILKLLIFLMS